MIDPQSFILQSALYLLLGNSTDPLQVTTLEDAVSPPPGEVTLRNAVARAQSGDTITFAESLDGGSIELSIIGESHSILPGEVMTFVSGTSQLLGFFPRDYGASALYATKDITLDASQLSNGITLQWTGDNSNPARVLAIEGNVVLNNINITGGNNIAEDISEINPDQPYTLSRGCGVAVWGKLTIKNSHIYDNHCLGDFGESRDRGAFGGGVYTNLIDLQDSVVSGNSVTGAGAAGGGVYSVGGPGIPGAVSKISRSSITGNGISAIFTYGGGGCIVMVAVSVHSIHL